MKKVLAFDIGGTKISYCLVDENGQKVSEITKILTPKTSDDIYSYLVETTNKYEDEIIATAIATAGAVNKENTRVVSSTPNLPDGYRNINFSKISEKPVYVENDANAAAWAEFCLGKAKGTTDAIILTIGTGIGGGIITNGKLLKGKFGLAGEVGSMKISYSKQRICTCGRYDCWESYGSGTGLKVTAQEFAKSSLEFKTSMFSAKKPEEVTTYDIIEGLKKNDEYSVNVFNTWEYHITCGVISLTDIFNPEIIVFSGGLGCVLNTEKMEKTVNESSVVSDVRLEKSDMKNDIGMIGAGLLAFEKQRV